MATVRRLTFGDLLRRYRAATGMTQEELAARAGLSAKGIGDLERGARQHPRRDTVRLLADALGLPERDRAVLDAAARQRGRDTEPATVAVGAAARRPAITEDVPFLGRDAELAQLDRHLKGDGPPLFLFAGEPGIGKSRLLTEAVLRAPDQGWAVLAGGCHRRSGHEPYAPFLDLLDRHLGRQPTAERRMHLQGCSWLVRLLPELAELLPPSAVSSGLSPEQERRLMFGAVARYLANVAGPAGTLLILDDLQWAPPDALDLLAFLLRTASGERHVRIIGAYRDTEVHTRDPLGVLVADLVREDLATRTLLAPLAREDAAALVTALLADSRDPGHALHVQQVLQRAGGVPYFLLSCIQGLRSGALTDEMQTPAGLPWSVAESIRQRVAALSEPAQELLGIAAVIGRNVPYSLLLATTARMGRAASDVLTALDQTCAARLIGQDGERGYTFAHDLVREVVGGDLSAVRRALLHLRVAEALEASPSARSTELLAHHFVQAGEHQRAIPYLERASARAVAAYAVADAERSYRELIAQLDQMDLTAEAAHARVELGRMLNSISRHAEAMALLEPAVRAYRRLGDSEGVARATIHMACTEGMRVNAKEGQRLLQPLLASSVLESLSAETAAELFALIATIPVFANSHEEQLAAAEKAVKYARLAGNETLLAQGELGRAYAHFELGHIAHAAELINAALPLIESAGTALSHFQAIAVLIGMNFMRAEMPAARAHIERCLDITQRLEDPAMHAYATTLLGWWHFSVGDWASAREQYERAMALLSDTGPTWATSYAYYHLGQLQALTGRFAEAEELLARAHTLAEQSNELQALRWVTIAQATHDLLRGRAQQAVERILPMLDQPGYQERDVTMLLTRLARAYLMLGDVEQADNVSAQAIARCRAEPNLQFLVEALSIRALVCARLGRRDEAAEAIAEGLKLARDIAYPLGEAQAREAAGLLAAAVTATDSSSEARQQLEQALAIYERLGAVPFAAAVRDEQDRLP